MRVPSRGSADSLACEGVRSWLSQDGALFRSPPGGQRRRRDPYAFLTRGCAFGMEPLRPGLVVPRPQFDLVRERAIARHRLHRAGPWGLCGVQGVRSGAEAAVMLEMLIWGAGALVIGGYMLVALLRPDRF